jgi:exodeoxyribonuclease VII large subunit
VLARRAPSIPIIIYPTLVQGATAAPAIVKAIQIANQRNECDVLILARGGGSLEDLWPFNEESVAHAIFQSNIPLVTGVGHEVDFTIADFVADKRAPTPSAAAEIIVADQAELLVRLARHQQQCLRLARNILNAVKQQLSWTQKHLLQLHPKRQLAEKMQRLDFATSTLTHLMKARIASQKNTLAQLAAKLDALSPLSTLQRGYAIATTDNQLVITNAKEVKAGDNINVRLAEGKLNCIIKSLSC